MQSVNMEQRASLFKLQYYLFDQTTFIIYIKVKQIIHIWKDETEKPSLLYNHLFDS